MGKVRGEVEEEEGEAIVALGSLFKLTQIHLWDDGSTNTHLVPLFHEHSGIPLNKSVDDTSGIANIRSEEMGLMKEMTAMGLPVSFRTNKEWKNRTRGYQKKGLKVQINDEANVLFVEEDNKDVASTINLVSDLKTSDYAIGDDEDVHKLCVEDDCVQSTTVGKENHDVVVESCVLGNEDGESQGDNHESNEWKVYWDSFYGRSYFYNVKTQESTWEPPLGIEHLAYSNESHNLTELAIETTENQHDSLFGTGPADKVDAEKPDDLGGVCQSQCETEALAEVNSLADTYQETSVGSQPFDITTLDEEGNGASVVVNTVRKAKKESRRSRARKKLLDSYTGTGMKGVLEEYSAILGKYWCQRYLLFSRFDEGIKMDEEGWFSVTPELIAKHHAARCNEGIVIDCFTGVGGNAIQFASRSHYVIAVDLDPKKLDLAQHNAAIYGVADKIDFVKGDFFDLAHNLKAGTVFLSPPWGGPDYLKASTYDMKTMLRPRDGDALFKAAMNIASTVIMFLPRNVDINQLAELALSTSPPWSLEVEKNYVNGKLKAITAYYVRQNSS
ncbi:PREDICTED: trimethylguanosine synthase-like isoform X2 [Camelina sativa]|uniref:Trimethylguanosine synthase n=1 Tax=Camelina sativa TaxID=90675 RepID=A0ABM0VV08_CAMSA|nr:PREDICTED: trimethylguanosine synthase-like isoform X2 [Camelina sativa]